MVTSIEDDQLVFEDDVDVIFQAMLLGKWLNLTSSSHLNENYKFTLPTTHLQKSSVDFQHCVSQLPVMTYQSIDDLSFNFIENQYKPNLQQANNIQKMADYIKKDASLFKVLIDGHSDSSGNSSQNVRLSKLRADEVAQVLINNGVALELIEIRGHGGRYPIAKNSTKEGREANRRVTVRLVKINKNLKS